MHDVKKNVWNVLLWQNVTLNILGEKKIFFRHKNGIDVFSVCWMTKKVQWYSGKMNLGQKLLLFSILKITTGTPVVWEQTYFLSRMDPVLAVSSRRVLIITSMQDQNSVKKN